LRFCYSEPISQRRQRSTGGDTSQLMLNLNGQHERVDP